MRSSYPIEKNKWYSLSAIVRFGQKKYLPVKSRAYWMKVIQQQKILFFKKGSVYMLQGKVILDYLQEEGALPFEQNVPKQYNNRIVGSIATIPKENKSSRKTAVLTPL